MPDRPSRPTPAGHVAGGADGAELLDPASRDRSLATDADLPVVARLVIEIRSDGRRTVARGAMEDVTSGVKTAVVARGESQLGLALELARSIARLPRLAARGAVRGLLGRRSNGT